MATTKLDLDFTRFFYEQYQSIVTDAYFIVGNKDDAMDISDEALFRAYINWRKISAYDKPGAWVRRVAIRLAQRRRYRRRKEVSYDGRPDSGYEHGDVAAYMDLRNAIASLPLKQRTAVVLRYYDDLPVAEVADAMGSKEATVGRYLHEARERLRRALSTPE